MKNEDLRVILEKHKLFLEGKEGGIRANLERANLERANLRWANLERANLKEANLSGANLSGANLERADLYKADLEGTNLKGTNLRRANLERANLKRANLKEADLKEADLKGADLSGADLEGVILRHAKGNSKEIKNIENSIWSIVYTKDTLCIGCQQHSISSWESFSDEEISRMESRALEWWKEHKEFIFKTIRESNV